MSRYLHTYILVAYAALDGIDAKDMYLWLGIKARYRERVRVPTRSESQETETALSTE